MRPSAPITELCFDPPVRSGRIRGVALVLGVLTFGWLPLKLTEGLEMPVTLFWAAIALTAVLIPPLSLLALFLLIRRLLKTQPLSRSEYRSYRLLCLFTGPIGCVITVFRLTRRNPAA